MNLKSLCPGGTSHGLFAFFLFGSISVELEAQLLPFGVHHGISIRGYDGSISRNQHNSINWRATACPTAERREFAIEKLIRGYTPYAKSALHHLIMLADCEPNQRVRRKSFICW